MISFCILCLKCLLIYFSKSFKQLVNLVPDNSSIDLTSKNTVFTLFVPNNGAFDYLSTDDISYINDNITYTEQHQVNSLNNVM